ncbi:Uncharacterised protein [Citrobacter koseri]|uniref:Uncharacterized protein n=1 Tax=Citrobacter koseri TaxID=545 RepID=A0A2X2W9B3_CITKO|nr:Uncharacterised protein [Citrobacter koseri]
MATEVVVTDMVEVDGFRNAGHLPDIAQETIKVQVIADAVFVAFEVRNVNLVKTHQRGPQANVRLG